MKRIPFRALLFSSAFCLHPEITFAQKAYFLQAGSYLSKHSAEANLHRLHQKLGLDGRIHLQRINNKQFYQVWLGPYTQFKEAAHLKTVVQNSGQSNFIRTSEVSSVKPPVKPTLKARAKPTAKLTTKPTANTVSISKINIAPVFPREPNPLLTSALMASPHYRSRSILEGTLATKTDFVNGDLLKPILPLSDGMAYIDGAGKYGSDTAWFLSAGSGFRNIFDSRHLLGAYLFADYNKSRRNQAFWVVNSGLEYMDERWDGVVNGYFPTSSRKSLSLSPGSALGIDSIHFKNHSVMENLYNVLDVTGPGADGEVGYTWNNFYKIRTSIGGYYFNPKFLSDFAGIEGGIELPVAERFTVSIHDAYDRVQGNTFMGTLRFTLDFNPPADPLHRRLFDPLRRHLGAQQTGAGIPIISTNQFVREIAMDTNAWFFAPGGAAFASIKGFANCTYENPCGEFSQEAITGINTLASNARLLLETGSYNNPLVGSGLTLANGQQVSGRMNYFKRAAIGNLRPLINDSLLLPGGNSLSNLQIRGNTIREGNLEGIEVLPGASGSININNSDIFATTNGLPINAVGIRSTNNVAPLNLTGSRIFSTMSNSPTQTAFGIQALYAGKITLSSSEINAVSNLSDAAKGISVTSMLLDVADSKISVFANAGETYAVGGFTESQINITRSSLNTTVANNPTADKEVYTVVNSGSLMNILGSAIQMTANEYTNAPLMVVNTGSGGATNIDQSTVSLNATNSGTYVAGINVGAGSVNITQSAINLNLNHTGISSFNYGINGNSASSINLDGVRVKLLSENMNSGPVMAIYHSGSLVYRNTVLFSQTNSPATAYAYGGSTNVTNLGQVFCVVVNNDIPQVVTCP